MFLRNICLLSTLFISLFLKSQTHALVIFSSTGNPFDLVINNHKINKEPQSNIKAFDLSGGWQYIHMSQFISNKELIYKDSIFLSNIPKYDHKEFTYALVEQKGKLELQFKSVSEFSGPDLPIVPEAPKVVISNRDSIFYENIYQVKDNKPVFFNNYDKETSSCAVDLNDADITYALDLLKKCNDDETRFIFLHQIIDFNCYTTYRIKQLLDILTIDLDIFSSAKQAYSHITDKDKSNQLLLLFKYPAMKESFSAFLKEQENITKQKQLQCKESISDSEFDMLFEKIKHEGYESEKVKISKKCLINICLSVVQTKKIAELFIHDREKLEFIKCAYNLLTDKKNAEELANQFQFTTTKEEFLNYISK